MTNGHPVVGVPSPSPAGIPQTGAVSSDAAHIHAPETRVHPSRCPEISARSNAYRCRVRGCGLQRRVVASDRPYADTNADSITFAQPFADAKGFADTDTFTDTDTVAKSNTFANTQAFADSNSNAVPDAETVAHANSLADANTDANAKSDSDANANADPNPDSDANTYRAHGFGFVECEHQLGASRL
jgi:hypothetical protein